MRTVSISVTEASRNFADCVNRVRYQGTAFLLQKNGVPVAKIVPVDRNSEKDSEFEAASGESASERQRVKKRASEIW
jgi:prevent-host-death family protein